MTYLILILALLFNVFQASLEAWANKYHPVLNGVFRRFNILLAILYFILWTTIVYFFIPNEIPYWKLFFGYWFIAFLVSDFAWNLTTILLGTKISIWYYGTTKRYDRIMTKLGSYGWFVKGILGIVGIVFLLGIQEYINI